MAGKGEEFLRVIRVPNADATVAIGGSEHLAIGVEGNVGNPIGVLFDFVLKFAGFGGENFDETAGRANRDLRLVGANVGGEDGVIIVTEGGHAFTGGDFPEDNATRARAASAVGHEQLAAATEFDFDGLALGEGEDAEKIAGFVVEEEDLLLARDSDQRCPRAAGETGNGVQVSCVDDGHDG